ncbi:hypothetical protein [uncultured Cellulomonas sp.]|uniref:hypothetical protein n=1 Tax=uncultured Cellulomonas sp. TaxID=189682 RepID=UPI002625A2F6|nr:hypothetical protein [uncultured Cellulomonas sp.]
MRGMLIAAYGASRRDSSKPDTAAAAKSLGVSQRTVQRWLADPTRQHQAPRAATLHKLTTKARQAATTKRGRAQAIKQRPGGTPPAMRVSVTGEQGPRPGPGYTRYRTANFDLADPTLSQGFINAYVDRGEAGAMQWLKDNADQTYNVDRWHFDNVDDVNIRGEYGRD